MVPKRQLSYFICRCRLHAGVALDLLFTQQYFEISLLIKAEQGPP